VRLSVPCLSVSSLAEAVHALYSGVEDQGMAVPELIGLLEKRA